MRALTYRNYGSPSVIELSDEPLPKVGPEDVLVNVHSSGVNTGDWRIRAAAFPGILFIPGRLMFGLLKPRNRRLGTELAGTIENVAEQVLR